MAGSLLHFVLIVTLLAPFGVQRNHPPMAVDDQRVLLFSPAAIVDIPVLDNDGDVDGDALHVVALSGVEGGRAELVDGALVRVYPDWSQVSGGKLEYRLAHGTYLVSDGAAVRRARWTVWYWPVMQP
ncbi:MAG: Ig-like domain-containing protein [Anaerolineae bacterium]